MPVDSHITNPREFMELAVESMRSSISESRTDKRSPLVGAVLVLPNGRIEKAYRGEYSEGDHAEYTLLERKLSSENLAGAVLFSTLEPCAPGARASSKLSCSERIVNRRIAKVWVGIEDPDPLVDRKGIQFLQDNGVEIELFDRDLQEEIRQANIDFIYGAEERASHIEYEPVLGDLSVIERPILSATHDDLDIEGIREFLEKAEEFNLTYGTDEYYRVFIQLKFLAMVDNNIHPTGQGLLLFGKNPQIFFPHAVIRATFISAGRNEDIATFSGSLSKQAKDSLSWFKKMIGRQIDRADAERKEIYDYPEDVVRESIVNALAHRSYDIDGAAVHLEISDETIIIRSPGGPVKPITMERIKNLDAPYLSKNPKISYVFEKLHLSENRGLGFKTIRSLPLEHNLPLPIAAFDDPYLTFTFSRAYGIKNGDERLNKLNSIEARGFDYIRLNAPVTRKEYEESLGLATKTAERNLALFVELGLVKRIGSGPKTSYVIIV